MTRERSTFLQNARPLLLLSLLLAPAVAVLLQAPPRTDTAAAPSTVADPAAPRPALLSGPVTKLLSGNPYVRTSLECSVNVACLEENGVNPWQAEINSVVRISNGCTGVLVNNTREDEMPYVLTAHHCNQPSVGDTLDWTFEFNFQSDSCDDPTETPAPQTIAGATVLAAQGGSNDFALLQLSEPIPAEFGVSHAGWSLEDTPPDSGVVIGHPKQDIKRVTVDADTLTDAVIFWVASFDRGTIEVGSSGAPLFNQKHQVVGVVRSALGIDHGACSGPGMDDNAATILFPKLGVIWNVGNPGERLSDFLDPDSTGAMELMPLDGTGQLLPVELVSFEATLDGNAVLLRWETASELNNAGFEVQHRANEVQYDIAPAAPWDAFAFVEGHGTTELPQRYQYRAENLTPGRHIFRLKQIDFDGAFEYHPEVEVIVEMADRFVVRPAYPNPFNPQAQFRFAVQRPQPVHVDLFDMLGRQVQQLYRGNPSSGQMQVVSIDGSNLPSGTYVIRVRGESFVESQLVTLVK